MKKAKLCFKMMLLIALAFWVLPSANAQKQQEIPVIVTFQDNDADLIGSDGLGPYDPRQDRKLKAFIGLGGQLRFLPGDSMSRAISVTAPEFSCLPFSGTSLVKGNAVTLGEDTDGDGLLTPEQLDPGSGARVNLMNMSSGQSIGAGLMLTWRTGSANKPAVWRIRWGGGEFLEGRKARVLTITCLMAKKAWLISAAPTDYAAVGIASGDTLSACGVYSLPFTMLIEAASK